MEKPRNQKEPGWFDAPESPGMLQYWNGQYWSKEKRAMDEPLPEVIARPLKLPVSELLKHTLKNSFKANGRASVREYWIFQGFYLGSVFLLAMLFGNTKGLEFLPAIPLWGLWPTSISVFIRRCHDTNRSGAWYFFPIGNIVVTFFDGDDLPNQYGNPV
jgi:uncharacterized membrane protein YhaH (DUF805 family)